MDHGQIPILHQMDIQFDAIATFQRGMECSHGIFRALGIMKAPVGIAPAPQFRQTGMAAAPTQAQQVRCRQNQQQD